MKTDEIKEILMGSFNSVYCDTCEHDNSGRCDECHRKAMNWGISGKYAEVIADEILKES